MSQNFVNLQYVNTQGTVIGNLLIRSDDVVHVVPLNKDTTRVHVVNRDLPLPNRREEVYLVRGSSYEVSAKLLSSDTADVLAENLHQQVEQNTALNERVNALLKEKSELEKYSEAQEAEIAALKKDLCDLKLDTYNGPAYWREKYDTLLKQSEEVAKEVRNLRERNEFLEKTSKNIDVCMGVGDGSGQLFVYGSYESIKRVQDTIFERETLRKKVQSLGGRNDQLSQSLRLKDLLIEDLKKELLLPLESRTDKLKKFLTDFWEQSWKSGYQHEGSIAHIKRSVILDINNWLDLKLNLTKKA